MLLNSLWGRGWLLVVVLDSLWERACPCWRAAGTRLLDDAAQHVRSGLPMLVLLDSLEDRGPLLNAGAVN